MKAGGKKSGGTALSEIIEKQKKEKEMRSKKQTGKKQKKAKPMANAATLMKRLLFFKESGNKSDQALLELIASLFREKNVAFRFHVFVKMSRLMGFFEE